MSNHPAVVAARVCPKTPGGQHMINHVKVVHYDRGFTRIRYRCGSCQASGTMGMYGDGLNWNETAFGVIPAEL